jgi:hypothetical protein
VPILQLFDSSVLIPWLRTQRYDDLVASAFELRRFILSTVVAMELYAGTRSRGDKQDLDRIVQSLSSVDRVVWPVPEDFYRDRSTPDCSTGLCSSRVWSLPSLARDPPQGVRHMPMGNHEAVEGRTGL